MADTDNLSDKQEDEIASIVFERFLRARDYKNNHIVHQGKSVNTLLDRARYQYRREYRPEDKADISDAFGTCPSRYYGLVQLKTDAVNAWKADLMINSMDACFTVSPSPVPSLDKATLDRIREGVKNELVAKMLESGVLDPDLLLTTRGGVNSRVETFLQDRVRELKKVEDARVISMATDMAGQMQTRMRDDLIQGDFRSQYQTFSFNQILTGIGFMRFPDWRRVPILKHVGSQVREAFEVRPMFRNVEPEDMYPVPDSNSLQTCTAVIEVENVRKVDLINMIGVEDYNDRNIRKILEEYESAPSRNWLSPENDSSNKDGVFWGLDETIPLLHHEGYLSGAELKEAGISGYDDDEYVNAYVIVCGERTIRVSVTKAPTGFSRTYHQAAFSRFGSNIWDCTGIAAKLWDTEQRINRMMFMYEHNIDWSARPPLMRNDSGLKNKDEDIVPGNTYDVDDAYAPTGNFPDPIRPVKGVSAQYQIIMNQLQIWMRQADEECGIPAYAYGAQDFGRASLGEFTQRMSNALRVIKNCALNEDIGFIEPAFKTLFIHLMKENDTLREGQDVDIVVRGMTGILKADIEVQRKTEVFGLVANMAAQGQLPKQVFDFGVRQLLESAGYPVDALGLTDPQIDMALAQAATLPVSGAGGGMQGQQVPQLDGRSNVPAQNVANPDGTSNAALPLNQGT